MESEPDQDKAAATQIAIGANSLGLAMGAFMAGILAQYAPSPLRLSYLVFILLLIPVAMAIWNFAAFIGLLSVFALLVEWKVGTATQKNNSRSGQN